MTELYRPRRAALLCAHFVRNLAYFRAGWDGLEFKFPRREIWATINANFLDIAVLEWCKLLADDRAKHNYKKVVVDPRSFLPQLLRDCGISRSEWTTYLKVMRDYRDKFVAHLDDLDIMNIPDMGIAEKSANYLYDTIRAESGGALLTPILSLRTYYDGCYVEAGGLYARELTVARSPIDA